MLSAFSPAVQHLRVVAAADSAVQRRLYRFNQAAAFFTVTAICAAFGQPPSTLPTSFVLPVSAAFRADHVGAEEGVGAPGLQRQGLGCVIFV